MLQTEIETISLRPNGEVAWRAAHDDVVIEAELVGGRLVLDQLRRVMAIDPASGRARLTHGDAPARARPHAAYRGGAGVDERWTLSIAPTDLWTTALRLPWPTASVAVSPEGPAAKLVTEITSRSTPREGHSGSFRCPGRPCGGRWRRPMTAPLLAALAGSAILAAALLLRRLGPRFRVGRLLASAPAIALSEALAIAASGRPAYIRVHGRISSDEEFPDEHDRPLVFRRKRVEVQDGAGGWRTIADDREAVPFGVEERGTYVGVDAAALDAGLVVVTREAEGQVADLPAEHREGLDPAAPSRLVIEQVSAVEHAFVAGVPVRRGDETVIVAGPGPAAHPDHAGRCIGDAGAGPRPPYVWRSSPEPC
jgi:hypothetical protein